MAVLEQIAVSTDKALTQIQQDIRFLLGLGVAATGAILAVLAHGFHWI